MEAGKVFNNNNNKDKDNSSLLAPVGWLTPSAAAVANSTDPESRVYLRTVVGTGSGQQTALHANISADVREAQPSEPEASKCVLNELAALNASCRTKEFRRSAWTINMFMHVAAVKLSPTTSDAATAAATAEDEEKGRHQLAYTLAANNPFSATANSGEQLGTTIGRRLCQRLTWVAVMLLATYFVLKSCALALLTLQHGRIMSRLPKPQLSGNASARTDNCASRDDLHFRDPDSDSLSQLEAVNQWLRYLGDPLTPTNGSSSIMYSIIGPVHVVYFFSGLIYLSAHPVEIDHLVFFFEPQLEWLRTRRRLYQSIVQLTVSSVINLTEKATNGGSTKRCLQKRSSGLPQEVQFVSAKSRRRGEPATFASMEDCCPSGRLPADDSDPLFRLLLQPNLLADLVRPFSISYKLHRSMVLLTHYYFIICFAIGLSTCFVGVGILIFVDIVAKTSGHLKQLECRQWKADWVPMEGIFFDRAPLSAEVQSAYLAHDGSRLSLYRLAAKWAARHYVSPDILAYYLELSVNYMFCVTVVMLYVGFYTHAQAVKIAWLYQIDRQINRCIALMKLANEKSISLASAASPELHTSDKMEATAASEELKARLNEALTVAYLNFELFQRQHSKDGRLMKFLVSQGAALTGEILFVNYLALRGIISKSSSWYFLFSLTCVMMFMNFLLTFGAWSSGKVKGLMRNVMLMLACATQNSIQTWSIVGLWRRQVLTEEEISDLYAPSFLGIHLTYDRIVALNAYSLALWLYFLKFY